MSIDPVSISRTALDVEWQRMQIIAQNLANENTSRVAGGGSYRPLRLISGPAGDFARALVSGANSAEPQGIRVLRVDIAGGVRRVLDPGHPHADDAGFVTYPDVDHAGEMALMVQTARVYESNLAMLTLAQKMSARALEIGRR